MQIFSDSGFFSVVQVPKHRNRIQIRARCRKHLVLLRRNHELVARSPIYEIDEADFQFRIIVARWRWEALAAEMSRRVVYKDFEGMIAFSDELRPMLDEITKIGDIMRKFQRRMHPVDPMKGEPKLFPEPETLDDLMPPEPAPAE